MENRLTLDTDRQVFFYEQEFYALSNFSSFSINWRGVRFPTTEQAYHWERFWDAHSLRGGTVVRQLHREFIKNTISAHEAFEYAQQHKRDQRSDWDHEKVATMKSILRQKLREHEYVHRKLLETGDRIIIENSWRDDFWGWGPDRNGQNNLGLLWMEIRAELRVQQG